jgi:hypothetical protein
MNQETPDNWIERQPIDYGPQHDDACMVCDKIDCICPPELDYSTEPLRPGTPFPQNRESESLFDIACDTAKAHNAAISLSHVEAFSQWIDARKDSIQTDDFSDRLEQTEGHTQ